MEPMKVSPCFAAPAVGRAHVRHAAPLFGAAPLRVELHRSPFKDDVPHDDSDGASDSTASTCLRSSSSRERSLTPSSERCSSQGCGSDFEEGNRLSTTVIMRNIPNRFSRSMLLSLLDDAGFGGTYNMVYLPHDLTKQMAFGYAFLNFSTHAAARRFLSKFDGFAAWGRRSEKVCSVSWSEAQGDVYDHVQRYRDCAMMHESVPDEFKPAIFVNGERASFPPPTKRLRKPRAYLLQTWAASREAGSFQDGHYGEAAIA